MEKQVVVRFAPSPTGYLHIGGARTAIFNWLYAKKNNGKFILRIEDTDAERSTKDSIEGIVQGLSWLGLDWDEGPYFQSNHIDEHLAAADLLIRSGHAYKCFCTKEEIEAKRAAAVKAKQTYRYDQTCRKLSGEEVAKKEKQGLPWSVRLKIPEGDGSLVFKDVVYGQIEKRYRDLEDFIIVRSNAMPLYVLSNAVDDIRDKVTHVIRGQDGLANTPKQVLLYEALDAPLPVFAHMSLTLDPQKAKISKRRHGEMVAVHYYRENGFLPWALVNFLVLLGWGTTASKEIFSKAELIQAFSLEGISKTNSVFNINRDDPKFFTDPKALNINAHYIRTMPMDELATHVKGLLKEKGLYDDAWEGEQKQWFEQTLDLIRERFHVLTDFTTKGRAYFCDDFPVDPVDAEALEKNMLVHPELQSAFSDLAEAIGAIGAWTETDLENTLKAMLAKLGIKPGVLVNAIRVATTGQAVGPDFVKSLVVLGPEKVADRLTKAVSFFPAGE
jgi:glutamyl-tRNA synthetase